VPDAQTASAQSELVKDFWAAVEKNGDLGKADKIVRQAETLLRRKEGSDLYEVETARTLRISGTELLADMAMPNDIIRDIVNPELVAGVRITRNESEQLDVSLATRLNNLFQTRTV
ncbi:MAG: hypothetical protein RL681_712, partial [Candidatus Parcubacteria bacterium]